MKKGISLVALVVTIIVLVILAGAVVLTMMDDSILDKANIAVDEQNKKEVFSAVQREVLNVQTENIGLAVGEEFAEKLQTKLNDKYKEANATAIYDETKDEIDIGFKLNKKEYSLILNNKYQLSIVESDGSELQINDQRVSELLTIYIEGGMELTKAQLLELKKELHIEDAQGDIVQQLGFVVYDEINGVSGIYFSACNRMYNINMDEELTFTYVSEEEIPTTYAYAKKINQIITELETAFIGKLTVEEIQQKYNDGALNEYILTNCESIKSVETYFKNNDKEYRFLDNISYEFNGTTYTDFCDNDTFMFLADESGNIIDVFLGGGA